MIRLHYRDLHTAAGREIGVSDWRPIDQSEIDAFAALTDDRQWIHVDRDRAEREIGGTIVHGLFVLSLLPGLTMPLLEFDGVSHMLNYGMDKVRFLVPVQSGQSVRARQRLLTVEPRTSGLLLRSHVAIELQSGDRPACSVETLMLVVPSIE